MCRVSTKSNQSYTQCQSLWFASDMQRTKVNEDNYVKMGDIRMKYTNGQGFIYQDKNSSIQVGYMH